MSDSVEPSKDNCPVCKDHTDEECNGAEGLILTAVKAIFDSDADTVELMQDQFGAFEAHVATSMLAGMIAMTCMMTGTPIDMVINHLRGSLDRRMADETSD